MTMPHAQPELLRSHRPRTLPASVGDTLDAVDTPALIVDLDVFEQNLATMTRIAARIARATPAARQEPQVSRRSRCARSRCGAVGVCCQKVSEAEALVAGGVPDVLIANEVVGARKLERLAALARQARVGVLRRRCRQRASARRGGRRESGVRRSTCWSRSTSARNRCGVEPGERRGQACASRSHAARACASAGCRRIRAARSTCARWTSGAPRSSRRSPRVQATRARSLEAAASPCPKVTGAGTGHAISSSATSGVYDELQPGSYIFMDADYARNEWTESGIPRFEHSLFVWTTVMSRPATERADRRRRTQGVERRFGHAARRGGGPASNTSRRPTSTACFSQRGQRVAAVGDKLKLIPGHCDPTVNLYDCCRRAAANVEALWPITARGALL